MLMPFKSNIVNGTTTASYAVATTIDTRGCGYQGKTIIQITNLSGTNTMYYKIDGYLADASAGGQGGVAVHPATQTSIATSTTTTDTSVTQPYAAVVISVENNSGACAYQIQYITY